VKLFVEHSDYVTAMLAANRNWHTGFMGGWPYVFKCMNKYCLLAFSALTVMVGKQQGCPACKNLSEPLDLSG